MERDDKLLAEFIELRRRGLRLVEAHRELRARHPDLIPSYGAWFYGTYKDGWEKYDPLRKGADQAMIKPSTAESREDIRPEGARISPEYIKEGGGLVLQEARSTRSTESIEPDQALIYALKRRELALIWLDQAWSSGFPAGATELIRRFGFTADQALEIMAEFYRRNPRALAFVEKHAGLGGPVVKVKEVKNIYAPWQSEYKITRRRLKPRTSPYMVQSQRLYEPYQLSGHLGRLVKLGVVAGVIGATLLYILVLM